VRNSCSVRLWRFENQFLKKVILRFDPNFGFATTLTNSSPRLPLQGGEEICSGDLRLFKKSLNDLQIFASASGVLKRNSTVQTSRTVASFTQKIIGRLQASLGPPVKKKSLEPFSLAFFLVMSETGL